LSKIKPSNIGKAVSGLVYGAGLGFYKTINKGIGDTVGFGDEALCWLENGDHIECADPTPMLEGFIFDKKDGVFST
jgi:hypothetical protein